MSAVGEIVMGLSKEQPPISLLPLQLHRFALASCLYDAAYILHTALICRILSSTCYSLHPGCHYHW